MPTTLRKEESTKRDFYVWSEPTCLIRESIEILRDSPSLLDLAGANPAMSLSSMAGTVKNVQQNMQIVNIICFELEENKKLIDNH